MLNRQAWQLVAQYMRHPFGSVGMHMAASVAAGTGEALVFVLVVNASVRTVTGDGGVATEVIGVLPKVSAPAMLVVAAVLGLLVLALHWVSAIITARISVEVQVAAQQRVLTSYLGATWARQEKEQSGNLVESVSMLSGQTAQLVLSLASSVSAWLQLGALLVAALCVDAGATLLVVAFGAAMFLALRPVTSAFMRRSNHTVSEGTSFLADVARSTELTMELRVFGVGGVAAQRLSARSAQAGWASERARRLSRFSRTIYRDLAVLLLVGAVAAMTAFDQLEAATFGAVVLLVVRAVQSAQYAYDSVAGVKEFLPFAELLHQRTVDLDAHAEVSGSEVIDHVNEIRFAGVSYGYQPESTQVHDLTFCIARHEIVGIVGPSGGGKTTLVQLLLRLRRPDSGMITVNGIPSGDVDPLSWSRRVALVPQEPQLMEGTIAENISFWRHDVQRHQVVDAARAAHVLDDIERLPEGLDTMLGPNGKGLSGGQKQRIAIARALAGGPDLLVLDEPTSALDTATEALIRDTLLEVRRSMAVVVVAHRPSTLEVCDRIITIEDGRIASEISTQP